MTTYRHKKRGTTYAFIGEAKVQAATMPVREGDTVVVYRGEDGQTWVRPKNEFFDGRFEQVS